MRRTAFGIAESAIVDVQLSKAANQSAPVHAQYSGGLALIPVDISENDKNKLLFKILPAPRNTGCLFCAFGAPKSQAGTLWHTYVFDPYSTRRGYCILW